MKCYIFSSVSLVSFDVLFLPIVDLKLTPCIMKENKKQKQALAGVALKGGWFGSQSGHMPG